MPAVRKFVYQPRTAEQVREQKNAGRLGFDSIVKPSIKVFTPREGKNRIRILPPTWERPGHYGYNIYVHYDIGADKNSYLNLKRMGKGPDPIAEARDQAARDGDEDLAKKLRDKHRVAIWLIDRNNEDAGPMFWACPYTLDNDFLKVSTDPDDGSILKVDEPEEGYDINFQKVKGPKFWEYPGADIRLSREPSPIHEDEKVQQQWLDYITDHPIPECLQFYDYDYISAVFNGKAVVRDEEEDTGEPARGGNGHKAEETPFEDDAESAASALKARLVVRRKAETDDDDEPRRRRA